jgi:site-specific DNA recombinase
MNKPAALYARVSSDRQKENHTIASQVAALMQFAATNGYPVPPEWQFQDDGYSGATLVRPGLEDCGTSRRRVRSKPFLSTLQTA